MMRFGITGSIASGKSTAAKIISRGKLPFFSADKIVKKLYKNEKFKKSIIKKLRLKPDKRFSEELSKRIIQQIKNLDKLEKIIHPLVRKEMFAFFKKNKKKRIIFCEIPLLVESGLTKYFDKIILIKSNKKIRLKRYKINGGDGKLFNLLNNKQMKDKKKMKFCDYIVVNNVSLSVLKKNIINIINKYE
ncbi:dephospho-CoA kinase [Candidatus Pelagibacter bacterium]|nr:dephospho-CoA kinase [Candidatus Pelagibacter bacterium]MDA9624952.1 dephospho-CoA kinase [Candidatus Pelagibacter bacterium]